MFVFYCIYLFLFNAHVIVVMYFLKWFFLGNKATVAEGSGGALAPPSGRLCPRSLPAQVEAGGCVTWSRAANGRRRQV